MLQRLLLVFNGTGEVLRPAPLFDHGASFDIGECRWLPRGLQLETFLRPRHEAMLEAAARLELKAASGSPRRRKRHSHDAGLCPQGGEGCTRNSGPAGRRPEAGIAGSAKPAPQRKPEAFGRRSSSACGKLLTCRGQLSRMNTLRLACSRFSWLRLSRARGGDRPDLRTPGDLGHPQRGVQQIPEPPCPFSQPLVISSQNPQGTRVALEARPGSVIFRGLLPWRGWDSWRCRRHPALASWPGKQRRARR